MFSKKSKVMNGVAMSGHGLQPRQGPAIQLRVKTHLLIMESKGGYKPKFLALFSRCLQSERTVALLKLQIGWGAAKGLLMSIDVAGER